jgi:anti-sigma factor RsiW
MDELDCAGIEERLPWLLNGTLPPEERRTVEAHLATCAACAAALAATRRASTLFAAHPEAGSLVDYAFGLPVAAESRVALELHLAHCSACREEIALVEAERGAIADGGAGGAAVALPGAPGRRGLRASPRGSRLLALAATVVVSSGLTLFLATRDRAGTADSAGRVALVELLPVDSRTRGVDGAALAIAASVSHTLLLVSDRAETFNEVRARIVPSGGGTPREVSGLLPALGGGYALLLPARSLRPGELEIELEGRLAGDWSPIGRYRLRVEP